MIDGLKITFKDAKLKKIIKDYTNQGGKLKPILQQVGEIGERSTDRRHSQGKNVDGSPFAALSPAYARRKKLNKNKILIERNRLKKSLTWQLTTGNKSVRVGYGNKTAAYHMDTESPRSNMPLRNPLGLDAADVQAVEDAALDILEF